jgi:glutamate N-acetyltransferase/amino-acid N-acetyltransferase
MTTLSKKGDRVKFSLGGATCRIGGIAKGSGLIQPEHGDHAVFITTDAAISPAMVQLGARFRRAGEFNMGSIDGDPRPNEWHRTGKRKGGQAKITSDGRTTVAFCAALSVVTAFERAIAGDGEADQAARLPNRARAKGRCENACKERLQFVVVKCACSAGPNWGASLRVGYAGVAVDVTRSA